jgi:hypothetical protein
MRTKKQTFTSARAAATMDKITSFLEEHGRASAADLAPVLGLTQIHTSTYLVHMEQIERIHCVERPVNIQSGRTPTIWAAGPEPVDAHDVDAAGRKGFERQVVVRTTWESNCARMQLECFLFGVPGQGARA